MSNNINVGHLFRKRTVRSLSGNIIDMSDEANGGVIISKGRVVNQEYINELARKEEDRKLAGKAMAEQVTTSNAPDRTVTPSQVNKLADLEKRIDGQDAKLDAILAALSNK